MQTFNQSEQKWQFFNAGGNRQVLIQTAQELANISKLDKKLWASLSCPSSGLATDAKTLAFLDADGDGRIRHDELVDVCRWICKVLKNPDSVFENSQSLELSNINASDGDGAKIYSAAKRIKEVLAKKDDRLCVDDFSDTTKIFANTAFNADGIITKKSAQANAELGALIEDIIFVCGSKPDRSGLDGLDSDAVAEFFNQLDAVLAWKLSSPDGDDAKKISSAAFEAYKSVEKKIDDFFMRAKLLKFDVDALESVNPSPEMLSKILQKPMEESGRELAELPVSRVTGALLALSDNINPMWAEKIGAFNSVAVAEIFGGEKSAISLDDWNRIKAAFADYSAWVSKKPNLKIESLASGRIEEISKRNLRGEFAQLFESEAAVISDVENISNVEKLVRLNANLNSVIENFVNFKQFYDGELAAFQCGKLYIDRRVCRLCINVRDATKHALFAPFSGVYLLYCVCRRAGMPDMTIAAAVTAGDCDNLMVGRNGVFYDRQGRDWDATVTSIVTNPISISEAFFSPYKRFAKWLTEQISKRAALADKAVDTSLTSGTDKDKPKGKIDVGTVAALGVAVSGLTAVFGMFLDKIFSLGAWLPVGVLGVILAISLPSMILAAMKLRTRNLAPLLDANGWAVNTKAKISMPMGARLTTLAPVPSNSVRAVVAVLIVSIAIGVGVSLYFAN